jgi:hypothetical protein
MGEITPLTGDLAMQPAEPTGRFAAPSRPSPAACDETLPASDPIETPAEVTRVADQLSVGRGDELADTDIDPDRRVGRLEGGGWDVGAEHRDSPPATLATHRQRLRDATETAIRAPEPDCPDALQVETAGTAMLVDDPPTRSVRVLDRIPPWFALETRETGTLSAADPAKEAIERPSEPSQGSAGRAHPELQDRMIPPRQRAELFESRNGAVLVPPHADAFLEGRVVQLALCAEQPDQRLGLTACGLQHRLKHTKHTTIMTSRCHTPSRPSRHRRTASPPSLQADSDPIA